MEHSLCQYQHCLESECLRTQLVLRTGARAQEAAAAASFDFPPGGGRVLVVGRAPAKAWELPRGCFHLADTRFALTAEGSFPSL